MAVCQWHLSLFPDSRFLSLDSDLFWLQRWGLPVVCMAKKWLLIFWCDILWPEVQSHSDDSHVYATGPSSAHTLTQVRPKVVFAVFSLSLE